MGFIMPQAWRSARRAFVTLAFLLVATSAFAAPARTVLVFGDSLSAGYGLAPGEDWPALLAAKLADEAAGWRLVNASVSGETTAGGLSRIDRALAEHEPDVVLVELGANDALRGLPLDLAERNLDAIVAKSQAAGAKVLLLGMRIPPNYGPEYTERFVAMFANVAQARKTAFVPFLLAPIATDRANFQEDDLHPIAATQPKLVAFLWPEVARLL
ncbi:MAG TPA: arylesterase [Xanthomonadales bacterium]|nr:arylesterase [Xanthomonadales bacterium]